MGFLTVSRDRAIPLHDHPDTAGVLLVIFGRIRIDRYDRVFCGKPRNGRPLELRHRGSHVLTLGGVSCFSPTRGNLHRLTAVSDKCTMLSVHYRMGRGAKVQSLYFAISTGAGPTKSLWALPLRTKVKR